MNKRPTKFRYIELADRIQDQIEKGAFKLSEKLPSLRALCQKTGYSMTTVFQAYVELEKRGVVEPRQRSGYYIRPRLERLRRSAGRRHYEMVPQKISLDDLIHQLTADMGNPEVLKLGGVAVAPEHLPARRLHQQIKSIPRQRIPDLMAGYVDPQGDTLLRQQISNLLFPIIPAVAPEDIIITNGCTEALSLSLKAVAASGDTVIVESPTDPWLRQTLKDSRLYGLEIPTHPRTGLDLDAVEKIVGQEKIAACIVNPNCQNPLGFIMPDDRKQKLLGLLAKQDIPTIENDVCGELYFGKNRPNPIKKWDTDHTVLYCASFSKVLAPGLRIGWVVPGRYKAAITRMKLNRSMISPTLTQAVVANYLKEGNYERHLRRLRKTIRLQYGACAAALSKYLPKSVRMTTPAGGLSIWIQLPDGIKGSGVHAEARKKGISILPGFLCSGLDVYDRYIRIGYGGLWDATTEGAIREIGRIIERLEKSAASRVGQ